MQKLQKTGKNFQNELLHVAEEDGNESDISETYLEIVTQLREKFERLLAKLRK
jgi:hypothetical protein